MKFITFFKNHRMKIIISVSVLSFIPLFAALVLPLIVRPIAEEQLTKALNREVSIKKIRINPFELSVQIDSLTVKEPRSKDRFLSFDKLYINLQMVSLIKRSLIVKDVIFENPFIKVTRFTDSTYNFSDLLGGTGPTKKDSSQFKYSFSNIKITGGHIRFADLPKKADHEISNLQLTVPFFSNLNYYADVYCTPFFSAVVNGTLFQLTGKTKPFDKSLETEIALKINRIDLAKYIEYVPQKLNFNLNSALFSTDGRFTFRLKEDHKPFLEYNGTISLDSVNVTDQKNNPVLNVPSLMIDARSAEIVAMSIDLKSITITNPALIVSREKDGSISLLKLMHQDNTLSSDQKPGNDSSQLKLKLDTFRIEKAKLLFTDNLFRTPFKDTIDSINVSVRNLSFDKGFQYAVDLVNRNTEKVCLTGNSLFKPMSFAGNCSLKGIEPKTYSPYFPSNLDIELKKGTLDFSTDYKFVNDSNDISISNGHLNLRDLIVRQKSAGEEIFRNSDLTLQGLNFNLKRNALALDSISASGATVNLKRLANGNINLTSLAGPSETDSATKSLNKQPENEFTFSINSLKLNNYNVNFQDQTTADQDSVILSRINLNMTGISNQKNKVAKIRFSAATKPLGTLGLSGTVSLSPMKSDLQINLKNVSLKPAQAYLADKLNIVLTNGDLSLSGKLNFSQEDSVPDVKYNGTVEIRDFATINKETADNFLLLKALTLNNMSFSLNPLYINIKEANVNELYSLINIYSDGKTNLQSVLKVDSSEQIRKPDDENKYPVSKAGTQKTATHSDIRIGSIAFNNCNINFSDHRFKNVFYANMKDLNGNITGLSSDQNNMADVAIEGKYDGISPVTISGKINPLSENLFVDLGLNFKEIDLTLMNPYSQKYLGYAIRKGKLSLDLKYLVQNGKLNSKNNIFLDQLTLGEAVKSPDATTLPVKLALALIRDQSGDIKLDVPVKGSLDDPKFDIGKLLLQVLGNIIEKTVTSPFTALSALFGGKEELSYVEFESGSSDISTPSIEKLDKISNGLNQKKDLIIEIQGFADPGEDSKGLKKYFFDRKLKAMKLKDLLKRSDKNISIDSVSITSEEYEKYLGKVYNSEKFEKPRTKLGFVKALSASEMENLIYKNIVIKDDDLKMLAGTRALKIKEYLLNTKHVNPSKLFLINSKTLSPVSRPEVKNSRVEFTLKAE